MILPSIDLNKLLVDLESYDFYICCLQSFRGWSLFYPILFVLSIGSWVCINMKHVTFNYITYNITYKTNKTTITCNYRFTTNNNIEITRSSKFKLRVSGPLEQLLHVSRSSSGDDDGAGHWGHLISWESQSKTSAWRQNIELVLSACSALMLRRTGKH